MTDSVEAQVTRPDGTTILLRGDKSVVAEVLTVITGKTQHVGGPSAGTTHVGDRLSEGNTSVLTSVAEVNDEGALQLIVTDLKAENQADAARRLIYIALLARRELLKEKKTSRRDLLKHLQDYNLADGNTRTLIASDKALVKEGSAFIWLSTPAVPVAQRYVRDVTDENVTGKWKPSAKGRRRKTVRDGGVAQQELSDTARV